MGFGIVEAGNYNPSRSLMNVNLTGIRACVFDAYGTLLTLTAQPNEPKTRFAENGNSWQRFGEQNNFSMLGYAA